MTRWLIAAVAVVVCLSSTPASARPAGCPNLWCGCYLAQVYGFTGALARRLWLARNWAHEFPRAELAPGNVAVFARGGRGGHVGKIVDVRPGEVLLHSGNDNRTVRTRWRSTRGLIAVVSPSGGGGANSYVAERRTKSQRKTRLVKRVPEIIYLKTHAVI